jgi:YidC/Oxa1 family membrane protein insertase
VNPLKILEDPLRAVLNFLHDHAGLTYGWSIVVLTLIVRTILLPLVIKQYKSMRRMAAVAPQIKELQAKYKGNRQKQQEELMRFYKENEINPFASCLPLVAQIPVFIALYYTLKSGSSKVHDSFMWIIPDVSEKLTNIGWGAAVLAVIYGLSQLLSTELSATPNMNPTQRKIMRFIPIVVVGFVFQFPVPAGLVIYWLTTNLWTCGQQLVMRRMIGHHPAMAPGAAVATADKGGSRTPPKAPAPATDGAAAAVAAPDDARAAPRTTPRRRRRGTRTAADGAAAQASEPITAPEPASAPEPEPAPPAGPAPAQRRNNRGRRPKPRPAGERPKEEPAQQPPEVEPSAPAAGSPNGAPSAPAGGGGGGAGASRRKPRPRGQRTAAQSGRRPPKKRRS